MARKKQNTKLISTIVVIAILILSLVFTAIYSGGFDKLFSSAGLVDSPSDDKMHINFIDVGQGDCTLITCGDTAILVDSGESSQSGKVINYIKNQGISDLDLVIATHSHSDHIGSMSKVLKSFEIGDVIMPDVPDNIVPTAVSYEKFLTALSDSAREVIPAEAGKSYTYGELKVDILAPINDYDDLNNMSVVAKISYGNTSVMLTGDAETDSEKDILKQGYSLKSDIIKLGHHGSRTSSSAKWLNAVSPEYAVVSCGENNDYGHPHSQTVKRIEKMNVELLRTDLLGDIVFVSDGKSVIQLEK